MERYRVAKHATARRLGAGHAIFYASRTLTCTTAGATTHALASQNSGELTCLSLPYLLGWVPLEEIDAFVPLSHVVGVLPQHDCTQQRGATQRQSLHSTAGHSTECECRHVGVLDVWCVCNTRITRACLCKQSGTSCLQGFSCSTFSGQEPQIWFRLLRVRLRPLLPWKNSRTNCAIEKSGFACAHAHLESFQAQVQVIPIVLQQEIGPVIILSVSISIITTLWHTHSN